MIERRVTKNFQKSSAGRSQAFLRAFSKLDEFLLNPQVRTCSLAVKITSRNNNPENRESTGDRSLDDPCPEVVFSTYHSSNLIEPEQEETHHSHQP